MSDSEFRRIIELYQKTVFSVAYCYVRNTYDADDITQDIFLKLYTYKGSFNDDEHIKAWLIRCTVNECKNLLSSVRRRFTEPLSAAENIPAPDEIIRDDDIYPLMMKLGKKTRLALYMHYYEGYEPNEIAVMTHSKVSAVYAQLKRGRKALKQLIENSADYSGKEDRNEIQKCSQ